MKREESRARWLELFDGQERVLIQGITYFGTWPQFRARAKKAAKRLGIKVIVKNVYEPGKPQQISIQAIR